ncbi:MAG: M1 family metallopeptidase [Promethearchaeota archaeon]
MKPINYKIRLEPDFKNFTFEGKTEINVEIEELTDKIVLNGKELDISVCKIRKNPNEEFINCKFEFEKEKEEITIKLSDELNLMKNDVIDITIDYTGYLNDKLLGFYRSKYEHNGQMKYIGTTQFEERDARAAFPCFDHPAKKATFDIEFVIDDDLKGISNTKIEEKKLKNGKKLIRFERTPKMSTYLLYFGIGDFEFIEDTKKKPVIRVATTPGKTKYGGFALDVGRKAIEFGEEFTDVDYPISKCDFIAVPDFAFGAMENYGAITFRENLLLVYPGKTSLSMKTSIASVIMHETAHLWFGDLVSPLDWKYIWLNESFASYFQYLMADKYFPEWHLWDSFVFKSSLQGMERDSLLSTFPIELPGDKEIRIDPSSAPIIYRKGAAIIRVLRGYLGEEKFKKGIHHFLDKFKFDCASTEQYWAAFEEATGEPISDFAESWVHQKGYPIINVKLDGNILHLEQHRFTFLPNNSDNIWFIPINILLFLENGEEKTVNINLNKKTRNITIPENTVAYKLNAEQTGFFRVRYELDALEKLGQLIKEKKLSALDSYGIENDLYALVRSGDFPLDNYLDFLEKYFGREERYLPLSDIAKNLTQLYLTIETKRKKISDLGKVIFEYAIDQIGMEPKEIEKDDVQISELRDTILWVAFKFGSENVSKFASIKFQDYMDGKGVHPDILSSILKIGAALNDGAQDFFIEKIGDSDTPEVEKLHILTALGCFGENEKLKRSLEINMDELNTVPMKNRFYIIQAILSNTVANEWIWDWYKENFDKIGQKLTPMHAANSIITICLSCLDKKEEMNEFFEPIAKNVPIVADTINMALEIQEVLFKLKERNK